ncbi:MAG TPA: MarR family transcriptional regulator, partial [Polyangiaceae bacterium]|nr:MarR family transcriptional regulator [Polyangiaceae bacterium]
MSARNVAATMSFASGFLLWRAAMRWQRTVELELKPTGLTHAQFLVLRSADVCQRAADDAVSQRMIASGAGLDEATTSRVARTLEKRGLLDRGPASGNGRAWRVIVTSGGRRLLERAARGVAKAEKRFFEEREPNAT